MTTEPLVGFSFPAEYGTEYQIALNEAGSTTPSESELDESLAALASTNATSIETSVIYGIDPSTGTIYADQSTDQKVGYTESNSDEVAAIKAAVADGLTVMVRPLVNFLDDTSYAGTNYYANEYRADFVPETAAQANNFFTSYKAILDQEATNALEGGATLMSIGAELNPALTSSTYLSQWTDIIASIRQIDPNLKLTYSASADYYSQATGTVDPAATVAFWNQLDYAGVDTYTPLANAVVSDADANSESGNPSVADLVKVWETTPAPGSQTADATGGLSPIAYLENIQKITGKPLLLTEIGYQNLTSAAYDPTGEVAPSNTPDPILQANLDQAFFEAWQDSGYTGLAGAYFWNWDALEDDGNADGFSPEHNPQALAAVTNGFGDAVASVEEVQDANSAGTGDIAFTSKFTTLVIDNQAFVDSPVNTDGTGGTVLSNVIDNFGTQDTIDLQGLTNAHITGFVLNTPLDGPAYDTLDLTGTSGVTGLVQTVALKFNALAAYPDGKSDFHVTNDDSGGTLITVDANPACYCAGTLIRATERDEAVEDLQIGDNVMTVSGALRAIKWIGRRSYSGRFLRGRKDMLPICIKAGALAEKVPARDLRVSPSHAMYIDNILIEAKDLINGVSIVQETHVDQVAYFHVELENHDVILAEGAWSESYINDDNRSIFQNAHDYAALYPGERLETRYCAPRVDDGWKLQDIRDRLQARIEPAA